MIKSGSDLDYKSLGIIQKNKHFTKQCLTKELSMSNFSLEDYHGGSSVSVPFMWESEPGTPKVKLRENPLPPLTPPPSYCYTSTKRPIRKLSKSNLLQAIFPKHVSTKTSALPPSPPFSSSSSSSSSSSPRSSSYSVPSSPITPWKFRGGGRMSSPRLSVDSRVVDEYEDDQYRSTSCLFIRGSNRSREYTP